MDQQITNATALVLPQNATEAPHRAQDEVSWHLRLHKWLTAKVLPIFYWCMRVLIEKIFSIFCFWVSERKPSMEDISYLEQIPRFANCVVAPFLGLATLWHLVCWFSGVQDYDRPGVHKVVDLFLQNAAWHYAKEMVKLVLEKFKNDNNNSDNNTDQDDTPDGTNADLARTRELLLRFRHHIPVFFSFIALGFSICSAYVLYNHPFSGLGPQYAEGGMKQFLFVAGYMAFAQFGIWVLSPQPAAGGSAV